MQPLGFGHADVVIAVPGAWIDVRTMADLNEIARHFAQKQGSFMRVATKYVHLTRRFFDKHGLSDYRIVKSLGATEGAPAAGQAECIVDITSTGSTLKANNLRVLEDGLILSSEANLVASLTVNWSKNNLETARKILGRLKARQNAHDMTILTCYPDVQQKSEDLHNVIAEQVSNFEAEIMGQDGLTIKVASHDAVALSEALTVEGINMVTVSKPMMMMTPDNPNFDNLLDKINMS